MKLPVQFTKLIRVTLALIDFVAIREQPLATICYGHIVAKYFVNDEHAGSPRTMRFTCAIIDSGAGLFGSTVRFVNVSVC